MNDQLSINGSIKDNLFNKLKNNKTVKHLEISYGNVDDDWHLIGELNQLVSLSIKDSFIDFHSFYGALAKLKNLEQITYNYYCFFNKQKNDQLKNIIINIKTFQIDFPKDEEPDFDFNNYLKETYKKKFHSIFEIKNCEKIFVNLEEVIFTNYQKFKTLAKEFDSAEKKLFKKIIYWGMESSVLKKFKKLNEISIDKEKNINLLSLGVFDIIQNKNFNNLGIKLNGIKNITLDKIFKEINILDISRLEGSYKLINDKNLNLYKYNKVLNTSGVSNSSLSIKPDELYEIQYGHNKKWKTKKNKNIINIFNDNIETIIFSDAISFINEDSYSPFYARDKAEVFKEIFKNLKNLKNIIFDFNNSDLNNIDSNNNYFLILFIYNIIKINSSVNIHLMNIDINKGINYKNGNHLIYLINFLFKIKLLSKRTINISDVSDEKLSNLYNEYIHSEITEILVVDDLIYNHSNKFNNFDIKYSDQYIEDINYEFDKYRGYDPKNRIRKEIPFGECFEESINVNTTKPTIFEKEIPNLVLIIKKNYLREFFKKFTGQVHSIFYEYISPLSHVGNMIKYNKDFKVKNLDKISHDDQKYEMALTISAKNSTSGIIKSNEFNFKNSDENLFLDRIKSPEYFNESMQNNECNLKELHELYLDGDSPHYGKYIELDKLNNFVPIKKLKVLVINGLINSKKYELPVMNELRLIELDLYYNSFNKLNEFEGDDKIKIKFFKNLPNLQELTLSNLRSSYDKELLNNSGYFQYGVGRWHYTGVDFSDIHELKKLKKIRIWGLDCKDLTSIKEFPAVEELTLNIFQTTKDHGPDEDKYLSPPINDKSLSFFKNSKMIKKLILRLGDVPYMEDLYGDFLATRYVGNSEFIDYISHNIKELALTINFDIKKQSIIQDIINKICNRFLKLEKLELSFGIAIDENSFDWDTNKYREKLLEQTLDFKKIIKLKNLTKFSFYNPESAIKFKFINFHEIIKLKKLNDIRGVFESISFKDFRETRKLFKNEKYGDPNYYDDDYDYMCEEDENYKSDWTRFRYINSDDYGEDWYTLEDRFIALEKKINEKKYKKTTIIKKRS